MILGLGGFAGAFYTISFSYPPFFISVNWSDCLPLLAALAFGGRYGFIASTVGLGSLYPFVLWPGNGWACLVTTVLLIAWPTVNGYLMGLRSRSPSSWNRPHLVYALSVLGFGLLPLVLFPLAMGFNPPFWYPGAELSMPLPILYSIQIKGTITIYVLIILDDYLLKLPAIRRLFGLEIRAESRGNNKVALSIFMGSLLLWSLSVFLDRVLVTHAALQGPFRIENPYEAISLLVFLAGGVFIGSLTVGYAESRLRAEDQLVASQSRMQLAASAANIGIWDWDVVADRLVWDDSMYRLYGIRAQDFGGAYEAWSRTIHPEDRAMADGEVQAALRGEREYAPEFRIQRPDGCVRCIKAASQVIRGRDGAGLRMIGVNIDITERREAEERTLRSLLEKENLIRELYHRTKNTLQVTRGLIMLQAAKYPAIPEMQELAKTTDTRIQAISLVHQMLYKGRDLSHLAINEYIHDLAEMVFQANGISQDRIALECDIEDRSFLLDTAIPLGLILNELLTNSLKYAFPGGRAGKIGISLSTGLDGKELLRYADDGVGLPESFDFRSQESLGLKLVYSIGEQQMMGSVEMRSSGGVECVLEFPVDLYQERV